MRELNFWDDWGNRDDCVEIKLVLLIENRLREWGRRGSISLSWIQYVTYTVVSLSEPRE